MAKSLTDPLLFGTVRVECETTFGIATGTAFHYRIENGDGRHIPLLITNKHVVEGARRGRLRFLLRRSDGTPDFDNHLIVDYPDFETHWVPHPNPGVDLCALPLADVVLQEKIYYQTFSNVAFLKPEELKESTAIENVVVVGYPNGIWDEKNNMPIVRRGITATSLRLDYNGRPEFLVDAAIFPGSSGSPVFLVDTGIVTTVSEGTVIGSSRLRLLGILYAGHVQTLEGDIRSVEVPTRRRQIATTDVSMHLGIVIKAPELEAFTPIFVDRAMKVGDSRSSIEQS